MKDYAKEYEDYLDLKVELVTKETKVIDNVREWFTENYPEIMVISVYVNERPMIDQLCITFHEKIYESVISHFCEEFDLNLKRGIYEVKKDYNWHTKRTREKRKWVYSFQR